MFAFRIIGTVRAESVDEALRAVAAYTDPENGEHEGHESETEPIQAIAYQWQEIDEAAELGDTYDSRDVTRVLEAARRG